MVTRGHFSTKGIFNNVCTHLWLAQLGDRVLATGTQWVEAGCCSTAAVQGSPPSEGSSRAVGRALAQQRQDAVQGSEGVFAP